MPFGDVCEDLFHMLYTQVISCENTGHMLQIEKNFLDLGPVTFLKHLINK